MKPYVKVKFKDELEWKEIRRSGIGGSDIGAIMGYNKYKTPLDVWREKVYGIESEETEKMRFGKLLEEVVAKEFSERYNLKINKPKYILRSRKYPLLIASIDYFVYENDEEGILEVKTTSSYVYKSWQNFLPMSYYLQLQHYLLVSGLKWGYIAILINGQQLERLKFERDEEAQELIIKEASEFWNYVSLRTPPPQKNIEEPIPEGTIEADLKILSLYNDINEIKGEIKGLEEKLETKMEELKKLIEDKEEVIMNGVPIISYKPVNRYVFDTKKFQEENPVLYQQYLKLQTTRPLKIINKE